MFLMKLLLIGIFSLSPTIVYSKSFCCQQNPCHSLIEIKTSKSISESERKLLSCFVDHLLYDTFIGYVLVGGKALAFDNIPHHEKLITKWWKSYSSLQYFLDHSRNDLGRKIFCRIDFQWDSNFFYYEEDDGNEVTMFLTNKEILKEVLRENIGIFNNILGSSLTFSEVFDLYLGDEGFRKKILKNPHLLGILLGYGEENASLYHSMRNINRTHYLSLRAKIEKISNLNIRPCVDFNKLHKPYHPSIAFPGFVGDPNAQETKKIILDFKKFRRQVLMSASSR